MRFALAIFDRIMIVLVLGFLIFIVGWRFPVGGY